MKVGLITKMTIKNLEAFKKVTLITKMTNKKISRHTKKSTTSKWYAHQSFVRRKK